CCRYHLYYVLNGRRRRNFSSLPRNILSITSLMWTRSSRGPIHSSNLTPKKMTTLGRKS
ncbi:hypothetical protein NDU88_009443, partial [Pleurodeles waltl]